MQAINWKAIESHLTRFGYASVPNLVSAGVCETLIDLYDEETLYRSRVSMERHAFGAGEYKYYAYPLPGPIQELRQSLYPPLAKIANEWNRRLKKPDRFPETHADYLKNCHKLGQPKPTPLILKYEEGGYNCLHQDLYGEEVFPLQIAILLSEPENQFAGGEFILTEQRPRMQSRAQVVPLKQGDATIFPVQHRPCQGRNGFYRVTMRHGVSRVTYGERHTLGIIFHDTQ